MWWADHEISKGGVRGSVHDVLEMQTAGARITESFLNGKFNMITDPAVKREKVGEFLDGLRNAYADQLEMPGIGSAFRKWFADQGI